MPVYDSTPHIVRDTDPFTDPIRDKILSFEHLDEGWQFGEGVPAPAAMVQSSLKVLNAGRTLGLRADAFPGPEAEIAVVFYQGERCLEILVRLDEEHTVFDVSLEEGIGLDYDEIESAEGVSFNYHDSISLVDIACIRENTDDICAYLSRFYPGVALYPIVLWLVDIACINEYYPAISLQQKFSDSGDPCHYELENLSNSQAEKIYKKKCSPKAYWLCTDARITSIDEDELHTLMSAQ